MNKSIKINDMRTIIYARDNYCCHYPGCNIMGWSNLELAHRIAQTESNKKYIQNFIMNKFKILLTKEQVNDIIHHRFNLVTVCHNKAHNSFFNIANNPQLRDNLILKIWEDLK